MKNRKTSEEQMLIDFALNRCEGDDKQAVEDRLARDEAFAAHHRDVANTLGVLRAAAEIDPPADLVDRTMARIRQKRQTDALLAREGMSGPTRRPTFSLRELGAIASVAAILLCVLLPVVRRASEVTVAGQCSARIGQIGSALTQYANDNEDRLPGAGDQENWLGESSQAGTSAALFKLVSDKYAKPEAFRCPAGSRGNDTGSFEVRAGMVDFPSADTVAYSYQHTLKANELSRTNPALATVADSMAILADQSPAFDRAQPSEPTRPAPAANSPNHGGTGQNVLYLDMHVDWVKTPAAGVMGNNIYLIDGVDVYNGDEVPAAVDTFLLPAYTRP